MTSQPASYFSQRTNGTAEEAAETTSACDESDPTSSPRISTLAGSDQLRYHREVARIGAEVADALDYAHRRGVLHRDIKPSNLLLDAHGTAWVTDFGLAKFEGSENLTETNDLVGTLRYMAPERFDGKSDARCDIYSLGVSLYEMLALRPAFDDSNQALLIRRILHDTPTPLRTHDTQVSLDLSTVIHKAMAREPSDRFATAAELADELRRVISNRPIKSRHASPVEQYWRWCKRNKLLAALNALAASLTITIAVISTVAAVWLNRSYGELNRSTLEVKKQLAIAKDAENQKSEQLWEAKVAQARASRFTRRAGQRFDALAVLEQAAKLSRQLGHPPARFDTLRNEAIACMALPDVRFPQRFGSQPPVSYSFDVDEGFDRYARVDRLGNVTVRRVADETELYRLEGFDSGSEAWVYLAPDGRSLFVISNNHQFKVWRLDTPRAVLLLADSARTLSQFSADSRRLAIVSSRGELTLLDCATGQQRALLPGSAALNWIAIHPDGRQLAVGVVVGQKYAVQVRTLEDPTPTAALTLPGEVGYLAWNPDGRRLVAACPDQKLYVWDVAQPRAIVLEGHKNGGILAAFNHRGDLLASDDWSGVLRFWDPRTGQQVLNALGGHHTLRFSQDDRYLNARAAKGLEVLEVATGREYRTLAGDPTRGSKFLSYFSFSPDGRVIASGTHNGVRFWNPATGEEMPHIASPNYTTVGFPADAREMLTYGPTGLFRWQVRTGGGSGVLRIGPPESLLATGSIMQMAHSRDGRVVGLAGIAPGALLMLRGSTPRIVPLGPQVDVRTIAVSSDGRWAATGSHNGNDAGVFVWDTATGRRVAILPVGDMTRVVFSPDGHWLATDGGGATRLWAVDTWRLGLTVEGLFPRFTPDSAVLALVRGDVICLVDSATGRELAALDAPELDRPTYTEFSPDGTRLAATTEDRDSIHVWDLRLIRSQLATLGLDWDRASYPPETKPAGAVKLTIIDPPDPDAPLSRLRHLLAPWRKGGKADARDYVRRGDELVRLGWHGLALWDYDATVRRFPGQSEARMHRGLERFHRGWWAVAAADFLAVLEGAGTNERFVGPARCRLAWAYHELGRHADAATELGKLLDLSPASWMAGDRASLLILRAEFHDRAGKPDQATADRDLAAKVAPNLADAANTRAWGWLMPPPSPPAAENWRFAPRHWSSRGRPSNSHRTTRCTGTPSAWPCTGPATTPRPKPYWRARSRVATAGRRPGTCTRWPCASTTSVTGKEPGKA